MIPEAVELVEGYRRKTLSPVEVTQAALDAIDAYDQRVNAFVLVDAEGALAAAKQSEARWHSGTPLGPGDGVPTSIKDALWTRGWPTLRGSSLIDAAGPWEEDAPCVARLRETGAVILGKTTTPEYSWKGVTDSPRHGVTGNPWDPTKTSGGSSGGSAAAVGLGMGPWSVGTDGGGSVRIPAGVHRHGRAEADLRPDTAVSAEPVRDAVACRADDEDRARHRGAARCDHRIRRAGLVGHADADDRRFCDGLDDGVAGLRIGYSPDLGFVRNDPEVAAAVRAAVDVLADLGAEVDEVDPGFADPVQAFHVLWFAGEAKVLQAYGDALDALADRVDPGLRRTAALGATYSASDYLDATAVRMELGQLMGRFHQTYDVLVTPTLPLPAFPVGPGRAGRLALAGLDELDAVHLSVQSDPAARAERAVRVHLRRAADRAADRRRPARRRAGAARRPGVPVRHRLAPTFAETSGRGGFMSRLITVSLDKRGVSCVARMLDDQAPRTCAAVWDALPLSAPVFHGKYARNEIYTLLTGIRPCRSRARRTPRSRRSPATCAGSRSTPTISAIRRTATKTPPAPARPGRSSTLPCSTGATIC